MLQQVVPLPQDLRVQGDDLKPEMANRSTHQRRLRYDWSTFQQCLRTTEQLPSQMGQTTPARQPADLRDMGLPLLSTLSGDRAAYLLHLALGRKPRGGCPVSGRRDAGSNCHADPPSALRAGGWSGRRLQAHSPAAFTDPKKSCLTKKL